MMKFSTVSARCVEFGLFLVSRQTFTIIAVVHSLKLHIEVLMLGELNTTEDLRFVLLKSENFLKREPLDYFIV